MEIIIGGFWILVILGALYEGLKESGTAKERNKKELSEKLDKLLKSSNAETLAYFFEGRSKRRYVKARKKLKKEGLKNNIYSGKGYIYVVPCSPYDNVWENLKFNYVYTYGRDRNRSRGKLAEPKNYKKLIHKAKSICSRYPYYSIHAEAPYKIGYTSRDLDLRISELNDSSSPNYEHWHFTRWYESHIYLEEGLERAEKKIHAILRKQERHVCGEIFCAKWVDIREIIYGVTKKTIKPILWSD
jgi:hypothetical protein